MFWIKDASPSDVPLIQDLAERTWWPTYTPILSSNQIRYMLDLLYNATTVQSLMAKKEQVFVLLMTDSGCQGFAAYGPQSDVADALKLYKLYVLPENQGKGYGVALIDEVKKRTLAAGLNKLDLNVARQNKAKLFYEKVGFRVIAEKDIPLGPYLLTDYIMRIEI